MRSLLLICLVVLPALVGMLVCAYFLNQDWNALAHAFRHAEEVVGANGDLRAVTIAFAQDRIYRLNCFADGVGLGFCALTFAVGVHGLSTGQLVNSSNRAHPAGRGASEVEGTDRPQYK